MRTSKIGKNDIFKPLEFAKIWFHVKSEWRWNDYISTKSSLNFTFWKFLEHSVVYTIQKCFFKVQKSIKNYVFHEKLLIQNLCGFFQAIKIMTEKYWFTNYSTLDKVNYKLNMTFINDWNHYSKPKNSKSFFWRIKKIVKRLFRQIDFT